MPPVPAGFTSVGGRIAWAKILQLHIERYMAFFKNVYIKIDNTDSAETMYSDPNNMDNMTSSIGNVQPPTGYSHVFQGKA